MRVLLIYFSATGNTKLYSELMAVKIRNAGHICELLDIENFFDVPALYRENPVVQRYMEEAERRAPLNPPFQDFSGEKYDAERAANKRAFERFERYAAQFDILGFGSPVYFFRPAAVMESFIGLMPDLKGKLAFTYGTHMEGPIGFARNFKDVLSGKVDVMAHVDDYLIHTETIVGLPRLMDYKFLFTGYLKYRLPKINRGIDRFLERFGVVKGGSAVKKLDMPEVSGMDASVAGAVEKGFYLSFPFIAGNKISRDKCVKCGICVKKCPAGFMHIADDGYPARAGHCMYCLRCINACPEKAVLFAGLYDYTSRFEGFDELVGILRRKSKKI